MWAMGLTSAHKKNAVTLQPEPKRHIIFAEKRDEWKGTPSMCQFSGCCGECSFSGSSESESESFSSEDSGGSASEFDRDLLTL